MQTLSHNKGPRRHFEDVSTTPTSCIPMQIASLQDNTSDPSPLRSDCWNSPLCPRNLPSNTQTENLLPAPCGGSSTRSKPQTHHRRISLTSIPSTSTSQSPLSPKRSKPWSSSPSTGVVAGIPGNSETQVLIPTSTAGAAATAPLSTPTTTSPPPPQSQPSKEKRLPHHVIERRYRENLNSQIESLRSAVPSTSSCLSSLDMEDIGSSTSSSHFSQPPSSSHFSSHSQTPTSSSFSMNPPSSSSAGVMIRPLSKAAVIGHAAEYMRVLAVQNQEVERANQELRVTVEALRRLVNCEDCGVVKQIVDAGG